MIFEYILLGVISPIFLNLMHLVIGIYVVVARGNVISLGFSGISFLTKSIGMVYLTYMHRISLYYRDVSWFDS